MLGARDDRCALANRDGACGGDRRGLLQHVAGAAIGDLRREAKGENEKERHHQVGGGAGAELLQSICLRMNVGISMSLRSCDPRARRRSAARARARARGTSVLGTRAAMAAADARRDACPGTE